MPSSTISWKARLNRKSPTRTLGLLPHSDVGGWPAASERAFVHHVVMQQGGGVDELDRGRELHMRVARVAAQPCRRERDQRAQALAAGIHEMSGELRDQRDLACHAPVDDANRQR